MAIKVTTPGKVQEKEKPFPKLMVNGSNEIFYMVRKGYGLPLTGNGWSYENKDFADFIDAGHVFTDYNEPITIQNA